jgi:hypothetical protein
VYNSSHAHLVAWVKANLSSSQDTIISMYYGNPTAINQENPSAVWDENYMSVWHLNEEGNGTRYDSTSNNNDGTPFNYEGDESVPGKIGGSDKLDGIDDYIEINKSGSIKGLSQVTFEGWINIDNLDGSSQNIYIESIQNSDSSRFVVHVTTSDELRFAGRSPDSDSVTLWGFINDFEQPLTPNTWFHIVAVFDSVNDIHRLYLNGVEYNTSVSEPAIDNVDPLKSPSLGGLEGADLLNGTIDEFRVSNTARSLDWITTEYENQNNSVTFYSISAEENYTPPSDWSIPAFAYRKEIIIDADKVSGDLINFPVLIDLNDIDLHDIGKVQADGDDILFSDANGLRLDHEIELFDQNGNGTHAHLVAWVRIPYLSGTTDTTIYMYFGNRALVSQSNPTSVWDSNFKGVWHMNNDPSDSAPQVLDSTSNDNDGTAYNGMTTSNLITGKIDGCLNFSDTLDNYVNVGDQASLNMGSGDLSLSLWLNYPNYDYNGPIVGKGSYGTNGIRYYIAIESNKIKGEIDDNGPSGKKVITTSSTITDTTLY